MNRGLFGFLVMLPQRIGGLLGRKFFHLIHAPLLYRLGRGAFMCRPFRIDGAAAIEIGAKTVMQKGGWLYAAWGAEAPAMRIGSGCVFGYANHITAVRKVIIGDQVLTANNVYISDNLHAYVDISQPIISQSVLFKGEVVIGDGCWIGENACIIGASVGRNSVIGANAVVTRDIPEYSVAVGAPAVVIRRFDKTLGRWVSV